MSMIHCESHLTFASGVSPFAISLKNAGWASRCAMMWTVSLGLPRVVAAPLTCRAGLVVAPHVSAPGSAAHRLRGRWTSHARSTRCRACARKVDSLSNSRHAHALKARCARHHAWSQTSMHLRDLARAAGVLFHALETGLVLLRMLAGRVLVTPGSTSPGQIETRRCATTKTQASTDAVCRLVCHPSDGPTERCILTTLDLDRKRSTCKCSGVIRQAVHSEVVDYSISFGTRHRIREVGGSSSRSVPAALTSTHSLVSIRIIETRVGVLLSAASGSCIAIEGSKGLVAEWSETAYDVCRARRQRR